MTTVSEMKAALRKQLNDADTRKLVKLSDDSEAYRSTLYGVCRVCRAVFNTRFIIELDDNDDIHSSLDMVCDCLDTQ